MAENTRLSDLSTVIVDYVTKETAKFITGANSLANIDKYYSDLNALGLKEYQDIYVKAYATYQAGLKK
jgi:putative aldouronate transport system substrate-binding protein